MSKVLTADFIGSAESDQVKSNTNDLFRRGLLKYDLEKKKFFWDKSVNVRRDYKNN